MTKAATERSETAATFPPGLVNAYWFATFNALSFQMILGSPMVLYARMLDASATVLGIITGMMPLLVIFQIPAAKHIGRVGYKQFVYAGWGVRVMFIFLMALLPLTRSFLNPVTRLSLLLFLLFGFNLSRGISSAAWLPWITTLVPEGIRGRHLARDAVCVHVASCATILLAALCLRGDPEPWRFTVVFGFSALAGGVSLFFLKRIPDVEAPAAEKVSRQPVPWIEIARYQPFRKLMVMNLAWAVAYGGLAAFTVAYLKAETALSEAWILFLTGVAYLGGLAGLKYFESHTDRLGSKPVLAFCLWIWVAIIAGWLALAGRVIRPTPGFVLILEVSMGFALGLVNMNNTRLAMLMAPSMGRTHFFALYSVVSNVALGLSPVAWGLMIDAFGKREYRYEGFELNRFSLFFALVLLVFLLTLDLTRRLDEPRARNVDELVLDLLRTPHRLWLRIWPRG